MKLKTKENINSIKVKRECWNWIFSVILLIYPLRHIHWGLDLWDTGYNYANFQYMGLEHMDSMWLYSTYLSNAVGNLLMKLPFADSLVGMNFYTGLFVSGLALGGFWFCVKKLNIPAWITFVGEMIAISLCWCPTALLYNYLTYVLFLVCVVLLYLGLSKKNARYLFCAGICLGCNVLVRFPNLPEAALIVGVWAYAIIEGIEIKDWRYAWKQIWQNTLWCLGGYLSALVILLGYIHIRYGLDNYVEGIMRLFAMTDNATDYKPTSMIMGLVGTYVENLYWVLRIGVIVIAGVIYFVYLMLCLEDIVLSDLAKKSQWWNRFCFILKKVVQVFWVAVSLGMLLWMYHNGYCSLKDYGVGAILWPGIVLIMLVTGIVLMFVDLAKKSQGWDCFCASLKKVAQLSWMVVALVMLAWVYQGGFCSLQFYSYGAILWPGVTFLMLTMGIAVIRIFHPRCSKEEKLISGLLILVVLLTSIGSNNKVYPSMNNLFVAAPYTLWECWRFFTKVKEWRWKQLVVSAFPVKTVLAAFLALFLFQTILFGANFVFVEATGAQEVTATVDNNEMLKGVKMHPDRARWMKEISAYVAENDLQGREVILYGEIPALSYYLQMPSAFNPWSDLRSYSLEAMQEDMAETVAEMEVDAGKRPVIIVEEKYVRYLEEGLTALEEMELLETTIDKMTTDEKWLLIVKFMEEYGYAKTFENGKFAMYE